MTDPNNVPLPQMPAPNGTPAQQNPSTPQYGAPAPAPAQPDYGQFNAPAPAQPAYGQPAYGQPAPDSSAPGAAPGATPAYGQPAADPYAANAAPQFPAPGAAPTYGQPGPDANAYGQVPPAYNQYAAPTATAAVPLNKPYYDCPFPEAFLRFWKKYVVFKGRASRSEFWWWMLASFAIQVVLSTLVDVSNDHLSFLSSLWSLDTRPEHRTIRSPSPRHQQARLVACHLLWSRVCWRNPHDCWRRRCTLRRPQSLGKPL